MGRRLVLEVREFAEPGAALEDPGEVEQISHVLEELFRSHEIVFRSRSRVWIHVACGLEASDFNLRADDQGERLDASMFGAPCELKGFAASLRGLRELRALEERLGVIREGTREDSSVAEVACERLRLLVILKRVLEMSAPMIGFAEVREDHGDEGLIARRVCELSSGVKERHGGL